MTRIIELLPEWEIHRYRPNWDVILFWVVAGWLLGWFWSVIFRRLISYYPGW